MRDTSLFFHFSTIKNVYNYTRKQNKMKKIFRTEIKGLLQTLNIITEPHDIEYKLIYEYRYNRKNKVCYLYRKVTVFRGKSPIDTKWFNNDLEVIEYTSKELGYWTRNKNDIK